MKLLVITYEFTYSPFSGNGVLARSLVKSILKLGHTVDVLCCQPSSGPSTISPDQPIQPPEITPAEHQCLNVHSILLKESSGWRKLDEQSAWRDFVCQNLVDSAPMVDNAAADAVIVIDWTGSYAYRSWMHHCKIKQQQQQQQRPPPMVYLNFRVYSLGINDAETHEFYNSMEKAGLDDAAVIVALSQKDKETLQTMTDKDIRILVPPLRGDIQQLTGLNPESLEDALPVPARHSGRRFITCVARMGREKRVLRFVRFVESMPELWETYVPLLAGAISDIEYADTVKRQLRKIQTKAVIIDHFLSPRELAAVFSHSVLNFHPCRYEAYGMTIVEAGAFGCPSILASNGEIGATKLMGNGASFEVEFTDDSVSKAARKAIYEAIMDPERLQTVGQLARTRALSWDELAYGKALLCLIPQ